VVTVGWELQHGCVLVYPGAGEPDLALRPGERADVPHPDHGRAKVPVEPCRGGRVGAHQAVRGAAVEQLLVRVQEPAPRQQVGVVGVVEHGGRRGVQRRQVAVAVAGRRGAVGPAQRREGRVHVGVVVDVTPEIQALRQPNRVRS
jgi:hypothetical protein